jgi:hypothetical protein
MKKFRKIFCLLSTLFLIFSFISITECDSNNFSINVPYSANFPIIDGQWTTTNEWSDTSENILINENGCTAYFRTKHNSTDLFILIDYISDETGSGTDSIATYDYCGFFFDSANDKGNYPKSDDYLFSHYYSSNYSLSGLRVYVSQGNGLNTKGNNWTEISLPQGFVLERGFSSINDPYESNRNHRIYEASFPQSFLGGNKTVGFYMFVRDANSGSVLIGSLLNFPVDAGYISTRSDAKADFIAPSPKNWGNITFLDYPLLSPITTIPTNKPTGKSSQILSFSDITIIILIIVISIAIALIVLTGPKKNESKNKST